MNQNFRHPLDAIYHDNSLLLLEAMIPYVDSSLKLPLALLIKVQELQILSRILQNPARAEACGLYKSSGSSEQMMSMLCQAMGIDLPEQMKQAQSMMSMMNSMGGAGEKHHSTPPEHPVSPSPSNSTTDSGFARDDMVAAIHQILSEQEVTTNGSKSIT